MSKILVTGADGFIGSHLVENLVKKGYDTKAFVFYNSFNSRGWLDSTEQNIINEVEFFSGDIRDPHGVREAVKGCDKVIHLAALIGIPFSYHSPDSYIDTNVKGTLNILQACRDLNVSKLIHTSTSEVYGSAKIVPINENHPLQGQSPYSASKIAADQLAFSFYNSFNTPVGIIRPFNTYGPRQSYRAVIPTTILQLLSGKEKIKLGSIEPTRDFSYVEDTVKGFISALECRSFIGETLNLGSNFEISISDTVKTIAQIMGIEIMIEEDTFRIRPKNSEVERLYSDNTKAKKILNWEPELNGIDGFKIGLKRTIDWFKIEKDTYNTSDYYAV